VDQVPGPLVDVDVSEEATHERDRTGTRAERVVRHSHCDLISAQHFSHSETFVRIASTRKEPHFIDSPRGQCCRDLLGIVLGKLCPRIVDLWITTGGVVAGQVAAVTDPQDPRGGSWSPAHAPVENGGVTGLDGLHDERVGRP